MQVFTILGAVERNSRVVAFSLVYALLTSKESKQYTTVLNAVKNASDEYRIVCLPTKILTDFELAIIDAASSTYPDSSIKCCFFHLCQSIYRKVQEFGLQVRYNNPKEKVIKTVFIILFIYLSTYIIRNKV